MANEPAAIRRLARKLAREAPGEVRMLLRGGPVRLRAAARARGRGRVICEVVAPSLIPVKPGDRIKTDRRDARKLAELLRGGLLTEVHPPTSGRGAVRDLCRCREDAQEDLLRARHRMSKFLLRRGLIFTASKQAWGMRHRQWLRGLSVRARRRPGDLRRLPADDRAARGAAAQLWRRSSLSSAQQDPYREPVAWLRCFRGIDTVTAVTPGGGAARLPALPIGARADGLPRAGAERVLERRNAATRQHHQGRQPPRAAAAGRGRLALPASPGVGAAAPPAPRGTTGARSSRSPIARRSGCADATGT